MGSHERQADRQVHGGAGVPIAAELIWGLPGDNLADFERPGPAARHLFPTSIFFGYTLLPGAEFYARRDEYLIETIPVAGYGKAKGEYVVGCHSFSRDEGEEGYFLITAHIPLVHGHIMPLTTRLLALAGDAGVTLLRDILRELVEPLRPGLGTAAWQTGCRFMSSATGSTRRPRPAAVVIPDRGRDP